ncbi:MAG: hypothetical protein J6O55_00785 [Lachnospiraceae bacterium]|nr:hypothetical protein [Lachnospiraceae bacterium]
MTGCTTSHTSTTEVNVTTTDESGTKEYNFSAEDNNGEVSVEESTAETPADSAEAENKGDDYNVDYDVADGNLKLTTTVRQGIPHRRRRPGI